MLWLLFTVCVDSRSSSSLHMLSLTPIEEGSHIWAAGDDTPIVYPGAHGDEVVRDALIDTKASLMITHELGILADNSSCADF